MDQIAANLKSMPWFCGNFGNDLINESKDLEEKIAEAEKSGKTASVTLLKTKLQENKARLASLEKEMKTANLGLKPEKLVEVINDHKRAIAEAQSELERLNQ